MKKKALITALGAMTLLASGCVPMERDLRIDQDLLSMNNRLHALEKGASSQGQNREAMERQRGEQLDGMAKRQADLQADQDALRVEMQTVRGLVDDTSARRREEQETLLFAQKDAALRLGNLDNRLSKVEQDLTALYSGQTAMANEPRTAPSAEALYEQGRDLILNKEDVSKGRIILGEFIKARPQSDLLANAYYWIGEGYYAEKSFENAIVQFQDVIEKFPSHPKASAALYKQALSFDALGEATKATALIKKLVENYPASDEAKKAKERIGTRTRS